MDPVDPRPALRGVDGAGRAEHDHRHPVAPGIEDRHRRVHQSDVGMHDHSHRTARYFCVTLRNRDRMLFVQAQQHLRRSVAEKVDEAVVQAAIARSWIQRDIGNRQ